MKLSVSLLLLLVALARAQYYPLPEELNVTTLPVNGTSSSTSIASTAYEVLFTRSQGGPDWQYSGDLPISAQTGPPKQSSKMILRQGMDLSAISIKDAEGFELFKPENVQNIFISLCCTCLADQSSNPPAYTSACQAVGQQVCRNNDPDDVPDGYDSATEGTYEPHFGTYDGTSDGTYSWKGAGVAYNTAGSVTQPYLGEHEAPYTTKGIYITAYSPPDNCGVANGVAVPEHSAFEQTVRITFNADVAYPSTIKVFAPTAWKAWLCLYPDAWDPECDSASNGRPSGEETSFAQPADFCNTGMSTAAKALLNSTIDTTNWEHMKDDPSYTGAGAIHTDPDCTTWLECKDDSCPDQSGKDTGDPIYGKGGQNLGALVYAYFDRVHDVKVAVQRGGAEAEVVWGTIGDGDVAHTMTRAKPHATFSDPEATTPPTAAPPPDEPGLGAGPIVGIALVGTFFAWFAWDECVGPWLKTRDYNVLPPAPANV